MLFEPRDKEFMVFVGPSGPPTDETSRSASRRRRARVLRSRRHSDPRLPQAMICSDRGSLLDPPRLGRCLRQLGIVPARCGARPVTFCLLTGSPAGPRHEVTPNHCQLN